MSAKIYIRGQRIKSLDELMRQLFVIHAPPFAPGFQKVCHRGLFSGWPLQLAQDWLEMGSLYKAKQIDANHCNGGDCQRHKLGAEPCTDCPYCDEQGNI